MKSTRQGSLEHFLQWIVPLGLCTSFIIIKSSTQIFCAMTVLFLRMSVAWPFCCFSEFCSFYLLNLSPLSLQTKATAVVFRSESITSEIHTLPSSFQHCACPAPEPRSRTASPGAPRAVLTVPERSAAPRLLLPAPPFGLKT